MYNLNGTPDEIKASLLKALPQGAVGDIVSRKDIISRGLSENAFRTLEEDGFLNKYSDNFYYYAIPGKESIYEQGFQFEAARKYLPIDQLVICNLSACFIQDQLHNYIPEQLQLGKTKEINIGTRDISELFEIHSLSGNEGIETKIINGTEFKIFTPERCLIYLCGDKGLSDSIFYQAVVKFADRIPLDYDLTSIRKLAQALGMEEKGNIITACIQTVRQARSIHF